MDIDKALKLDVKHISTYSLILEDNTLLKVNGFNGIDEDLDYEMYKYIEDILEDNGYVHYEISNYSKLGMESKHNLVYWNNEYYYGFGLSASGYLENYRYDNTKNLRKYLSENYIDVITKVDKDDRIKYELILGFRKLKGINKNRFKEKFDISIYDVPNIRELLINGMLKENDEYIYIPDDWIYKSNEILVKFV